MQGRLNFRGGGWGGGGGKCRSGDGASKGIKADEDRGRGGASEARQQGKCQVKLPGDVVTQLQEVAGGCDVREERVRAEDGGVELVCDWKSASDTTRTDGCCC